MAIDTRSPAGPGGGSDLAGLDALDLPGAVGRPRLVRIWAATWPKVAAIALALLLWEATVLSGWKPTYVLPGPWAVAKELGSQATTTTFWHAVGTTMRRGLT